MNSAVLPLHLVMLNGGRQVRWILKGLKAMPAASSCFLRWISTSGCEYFSVLDWIRLQYDLRPSPLQGIFYYAHLLMDTILSVRLIHLPAGTPQQHIPNVKVPLSTGATLAYLSVLNPWWAYFYYLRHNEPASLGCFPCWFTWRIIHRCRDRKQQKQIQYTDDVNVAHSFFDQSHGKELIWYKWQV